MKVVDAHQHFWRQELMAQLALPPETGILVQDYLPDDLRPLLHQAGVQQTVLVQTNSSFRNTQKFLDLAEKYDWIAAVVGWVDLTDPHVGQILDSLKAFPKFKGARYQWEDESDPAWILRPDVLNGLHELAKRGHTYDLLAKPHNWQYVTKVADQLPDLSLVIDHIAKPNIAKQQFDDWADMMTDADRYPQVMCKLSGMVTQADWKTWKPTDLKPYVDKIIQIFGPDRVLFGSDWPVCLLAGSYLEVVEALQIALSNYDESAKIKILGENAVKFYRIT